MYGIPQQQFYMQPQQQHRSVQAQPNVRPTASSVPSGLAATSSTSVFAASVQNQRPVAAPQAHPQSIASSTSPVRSNQPRTFPAPARKKDSPPHTSHAPAPSQAPAPAPAPAPAEAPAVGKYIPPSRRGVQPRT
eukprot:TRINITY_DN2337_c1_g2_i1.p3 TRINITY_DN2337_c1_g2~~TRINITY_DN2337_c1_g2_i1.p3  ORF type:complete len:143 (-),score=23.01 TRINITY_DN2337_c1_g2_i1:19-420(-)